MAIVGTKTLEGVDIAIVVVYFLVVIATGFYAMCTSKRDTAAGYFLAGRFITFIPIGASLFSSCMGSEHFIGISGSAAAAGIAVSAFEVFAVLALQALGWLFTPVYMASGVTTLPEYMEKRFGGRRIQIFLSLLSLLIYILTKVSVTLFSAALFINAAMHWEFVPAILLIIGITALCTISGGLAAVIYTDTVQTFLMCIGSIVLMIFAFVEIGGIQELFRKYMEAIPSDRPANTTCGVPREDSLIMLRDPIHSDLPWPGFIFGATMVAIWYWCADQVIVQRALAAKNLSHAQGGTVFAGYLKLLPMFMLVMPGMISRVLYTDDIACATPEVCKEVCGNEAGCSNLAYPWLIMNLLPTGVRGVMVAVMMAAMISSLTSIFNSASSLFTIDIYPIFRKTPSNREQMIVGRLFVLFMTVVSILWIPIIENTQGGQLFVYVQAVQAYLTPPIATVFLVGILWPRANEKGAFWALITGFISGFIKMILEFVYTLPKCGEVDSRPTVVKSVNFLYFALLLLGQTLIVMIFVSIMTEPLELWRKIRTTFWNRFDITVRKDEMPSAVSEYLYQTKVSPVEVSRPQHIPGIELEDIADQRKKRRSPKVSTISDGQYMYESNVDDPVPTKSESKSEVDDEETTCCQRLGAPSTLDQAGNKKSCGTLTLDWLKFGASWFCGISLDGSDSDEDDKSPEEKFNELKNQDSKARYASEIEKDAQERVNGMVKSIIQKPKIRIFLTVNLFVILAIMTFITVFFSVSQW